MDYLETAIEFYTGDIKSAGEQEGKKEQKGSI